MAYLYILKSEKGSYYIGSTVDVEERLKQHNNGYTPSTHRMGKLELVFFQKFDTLQQARNIEYRLKKFKRRDYIEKIVEDGIIKISPA